MARIGGWAAGLDRGTSDFVNMTMAMDNQERAEKIANKNLELQQANLDLNRKKIAREDIEFNQKQKEIARKNRPLNVDETLDKMVEIPAARGYIKNYAVGVGHVNEDGTIRAEDAQNDIKTLFKDPIHLKAINRFNIDHYTKALADAESELKAMEGKTGIDLKPLLLKKQQMELALKSAMGADEGLTKYLTTIGKKKEYDKPYVKDGVEYQEDLTTGQIHRLGKTGGEGSGVDKVLSRQLAKEERDDKRKEQEKKDKAYLDSVKAVTNYNEDILKLKENRKKEGGEPTQEDYDDIQKKYQAEFDRTGAKFSRPKIGGQQVETQARVMTEADAKDKLLQKGYRGKQLKDIIDQYKKDGKVK
jgi:hypothetical protein